MRTDFFYYGILIIFLVCIAGYSSYQRAIYDNHIQATNAKLEGLEQQNKTLLKATLKEVMLFLNEDTTEYHKYEKEMYDCEQFTWQLIENASRKGFDAYSVIVKWKGVFRGHNLVGFDTRDSGMVFVEPQTDKVVDISPGTEYLGKTIQEYHVCKEEKIEYG